MKSLFLHIVHFQSTIICGNSRQKVVNLFVRKRRPFDTQRAKKTCENLSAHRRFGMTSNWTHHLSRVIFWMYLCINRTAAINKPEWPNECETLQLLCLRCARLKVHMIAGAVEFFLPVSGPEDTQNRDWANEQRNKNNRLPLVISILKFGSLSTHFLRFHKVIRKTWTAKDLARELSRKIQMRFSRACKSYPCIRPLACFSTFRLRLLIQLNDNKLIFRFGSYSKITVDDQDPTEAFVDEKRYPWQLLLFLCWMIVIFLPLRVLFHRLRDLNKSLSLMRVVRIERTHTHTHKRQCERPNRE